MNNAPKTTYSVSELIEKLEQLKKEGYGDFLISLEIEDNWDGGVYHYSLLSKELESVTAYEDDKRVYLHGENE